MRQPAELHGILAIDKPQGWTSHDVVARLRRIAGQREVGHGGTLDPLATGVLPLGLGQGTRVLEYLAGGAKRYAATVRLGTATNTYDAEGTVTRSAPWEQITRAALRAALDRFTGQIMQRPPAFSAIKRDGEPAYARARRGEAVELEPRPVVVYRIDLTRFAPPELDLDVECGSGTYIRSLAHDLGEALGSAAHLSALRRTAVGSLVAADAVPLAALDAAGRPLLEASLLAPDQPVLGLPALVLGEDGARRVRQGQQVAAGADDPPRCRAYDAEGFFVALLRREGERWQPAKVFGGP